MTSDHDMIFPLVPLRDVVAFPGLTMPLLLGRSKSIRACEQALAAGQPILLVAQREGAEENPGIEGLYPIGTVAAVRQHMRLPEGRMKLLVEGERRARIVDLIDDGAMLSARAEPIAEAPGDGGQLAALQRGSAERGAGRFHRIGGTPAAWPALPPVPELQRLLDVEGLSVSERLEQAMRLFAISW